MNPNIRDISFRTKYGRETLICKICSILLMESSARFHIIVSRAFFIYTHNEKNPWLPIRAYREGHIAERGGIMFRPKFRFTHDEVRIIVMALVEFKNQLLAEGRYTDAVDDLLIKFVD